uniref:Putative coat protein n=1 Tax=Sichuan mosquito tymo-like virus TaxID=2864015 RepID=A0A8K1M4L7_9VIRU|nr:putative coat protein [Sichuan mosquito tymo-like virus]
MSEQSNFKIPFQFKICQHDGKKAFHTFSLNTVSPMLSLLKLTQTASVSDLQVIIFPTASSASMTSTVTVLWTPASLLPTQSECSAIYGAQMYTFGGAGVTLNNITHSCDFSAISPILKDPFSRNDTPRISLSFLESVPANKDSSVLAYAFVKGYLNCGPPALQVIA